jgi:hypothetical protein
MMIQVDNVKVGDKMRISTELLQQFEEEPGHRGPLGEIIDIKEDLLDGTKVRYLAHVRQTAKR